MSFLFSFKGGDFDTELPGEEKASRKKSRNSVVSALFLLPLQIGPRKEERTVFT